MSLQLRPADWLLPLLICALGLAELATLDVEGVRAAAITLVFSCALLVARRQWTLTACTLATLAQTALPFTGPAYDEAATGLLVLASAIYALGRWIPDLRGLVGLGATLAGFLTGYAFVDLRDKGLDDVVFVLAITVPPYLFGRITRRLAVQAEQLERQQDLVRQAAVRDERDRISRELHDVIAHSLSAMVVQVAAARDLVRQQPERAERVLDRVAETGRSAIAETGRLLHVIRDSGDELGLAPTPGLGDLGELVRGFRADGLDVDLVVEADPVDLPAAVDVSAYRIVREALTNSLRYSTDGRVRVEVLRTTSGLTIRAVNPSDGRSGAGTGLGLAGLAERVTLLGGSLRSGFSGTDFELVATLPVEQREPA